MVPLAVIVRSMSSIFCSAWSKFTRASGSRRPETSNQTAPGPSNSRRRPSTPPQRRLAQPSIYAASVSETWSPRLGAVHRRQSSASFVGWTLPIPPKIPRGRSRIVSFSFITAPLEPPPSPPNRAVEPFGRITPISSNSRRSPGEDALSERTAHGVRRCGSSARSPLNRPPAGLRADRREAGPPHSPSPCRTDSPTWSSVHHADETQRGFDLKFHRQIAQVTQSSHTQCVANARKPTPTFGCPGQASQQVRDLLARGAAAPYAER